jgi:hypothetical protein
VGQPEGSKAGRFSVYLNEEDMIAWVQAEAKRQSASKNTIVRQAIRALMNAQRMSGEVAA